MVMFHSYVKLPEGKLTYGKPVGKWSRNGGENHIELLVYQRLSRFDGIEQEANVCSNCRLSTLISACVSWDSHPSHIWWLNWVAPNTPSPSITHVRSWWESFSYNRWEQPRLLWVVSSHISNIEDESVIKLVRLLRPHDNIHYVIYIYPSLDQVDGYQWKTNQNLRQIRVTESLWGTVSSTWGQVGFREVDGWSRFQTGNSNRFQATWDYCIDYPLVNVYITMENHIKSPFFMGNFTISMAMFNSFLYVYQRVIWDCVFHFRESKKNQWYSNHQLARTCIANCAKTTLKPAISATKT